MYKTKRTYLIALSFIISGIALFFYQDLAMAASGKNLKDISDTLTEQMKSIASLLVIISYVAGVGFALGGVVQFKAHKDNPTQVALSKPIVLLAVGACLLFLPTLISTAGQSIFGGDQQSGGATSGTIIQ